MVERAATAAEHVPSPAGCNFTDVYEREFTHAARFAWLLVRTSAVAEDLAQEGFAALYQRFEQVENPRGFVYRVI
ncbi:MAG: RNA polymerase sigma factor, partial [Acidimicrobiales bacterium]